VYRIDAVMEENVPHCGVEGGTRRKKREVAEKRSREREAEDRS
jgi:hypothetical protein